MQNSHLIFCMGDSFPTKQNYPCTDSASSYAQCIEVELQYFFAKFHFVSVFVFDLQGKTHSPVLVSFIVTRHLAGIPVERS